MLFAAVNTAIRLDADPEQTLHHSCEQFIRRFGEAEQRAEAAGVSLAQRSKEEMNLLWDAQKSKQDP